MNAKTRFWSILTIAAACTLRASVLTVTTLADSGPGSLRDLVAASATGDTIQFAVSGTIPLASSITLPHALTVQGRGASMLTVDANHLDRAFVAAASGTVVLSGMTISNGFVAGLNGADANSPGQNGGPGLDAYGGAILDYSDSLYLSNCWFTGNSVQGGRGGHGGGNPIGAVFSCGNGGAGGAGAGGALYATSSVFVLNCTFSNNRAVGGGGGVGGTNYNAAVAEPGGTGGDGGGGQGGAVNEINGGDRAFNNITFSQNRVGGGAGGAGGDSLNGPGGQGGGGGAAGGGAVATIIGAFSSDTIVSNSAYGGLGGPGGNGAPPGVTGSPGGGTGGGVVGYVITCLSILDNTIIADNYAQTSHSNYFINFSDDGYNFIGSFDYPFCGNPPLPTDLAGTIAVPIHPQLGPLAQNGSGVPTHAVLLTSPVLDAGNSFGSTFGVTNDERGAPRPCVVSTLPHPGDGSDIGAFELGGADLGLDAVNHGVVLSWPAYYGDSRLQSSTNLQGMNGWNTVTDTPAEVDNQFLVTNRITGAIMFYRLVRP